jgi:hypothetical protein
MKQLLNSNLNRIFHGIFLETWQEKRKDFAMIITKKTKGAFHSESHKDDDAPDFLAFPQSMKE